MELHGTLDFKGLGILKKLSIVFELLVDVQFIQVIGLCYITIFVSSLFYNLNRIRIKSILFIVRRLLVPDSLINILFEQTRDLKVKFLLKLERRIFYTSEVVVHPSVILAR